MHGTVGSYYNGSTEDVVQEGYPASHLCVTERMGGGQGEGTSEVTRTGSPQRRKTLNRSADYIKTRTCKVGDPTST